MAKKKKIDLGLDCIFEVQIRKVHPFLYPFLHSISNTSIFVPSFVFSFNAKMITFTSMHHAKCTLYSVSNKFQKKTQKFKQALINKSLPIQPTMHYYIIGTCVEIIKGYKYQLIFIPSSHFSLNSKQTTLT